MATTGELAYTITIEAELKQAQAAADELVRQKRAAQEAGQAYAGLGTELAAVEKRMATLSAAAKQAASASDLARYEARMGGPTDRSQIHSRAALQGQQDEPRLADARLQAKSQALRQELSQRQALANQAAAEIAQYTTLSPKTQEYIAGLGKTGQATRALTSNKEELRKAVTMASVAFPELGAVSAFSIGRMAGIVGIGALAIGKMKSECDALLASLVTSDWKTAINIPEKLKAAWQNTALEVKAGWREIERLRNAPSTAQERTDARLNQYKAELAAVDAVAQKMHTLRLAQAGLERDPVKRGLAQAKLEDQWQESLAREEGLRAKKMEQMRSAALFNAKSQEKDLRGKLDTFQQGRSQAPTKDSVEDNITNIRDRIKQSEADIAPKKELRDKYDGWLGWLKKAEKLAAPIAPLAVNVMAGTAATQSARNSVDQALRSDEAAKASVQRELEKALAARPAKLDAIAQQDEKGADLKSRLQEATQYTRSLQRSNYQEDFQARTQAWSRERGESLREFSPGSGTARGTLKGMEGVEENTAAMLEELRKSNSQADKQFTRRT